MIDLCKKVKYVSNSRGTFTHIVRKVSTHRMDQFVWVSVKYLCGNSVNGSSDDYNLVFRIKNNGILCRFCEAKAQLK